MRGARWYRPGCQDPGIEPAPPAARQQANPSVYCLLPGMQAARSRAAGGRGQLPFIMSAMRRSISALDTSSTTAQIVHLFPPTSFTVALR